MSKIKSGGLDQYSRV